MLSGMKATIRTLEEMNARAWPALETHVDDGWLLRYSEGYTRRANSVLPVYGSSRNLDSKIADCEAFYRRHHLPTIFKLTAAAYPDELDGVLAAKGYERAYPPVSVQTSTLIYQQLSADSRVRLRDSVNADWLNAYIGLNHINPAHHSALKRMLQSGQTDIVCADIIIGNEALAVGMGRRADDHFGIFGVATAPAVRRQGLARALVTALMHHAITGGGRIAFLQVTYDNIPARRMYAELGFCEVYPYWYRTRQT